MNSNKDYRPFDILIKIDPNFIQNLDFEKTVAKLNEKKFNEIALIENINYYLYFIGSLLEDKIITPRSSYFRFSDFKTPMKELMMTFKIFYNTGVFDYYYTTTSISSYLPVTYTNLNIDLKIIKLLFMIKKRIFGKNKLFDKIEENISIIEEHMIKIESKSMLFNASAFRAKVHKDNEKKNNYANLFEVVYDICKLFNEYNLKLSNKYIFYKDGLDNIFPKSKLEHEKWLLEEHLNKIILQDRNIKESLMDLIDSKEYSDIDTAKKIISSFPDNEVTYENPYLIYNLIGYLDAIKINQDKILEIENLYKIHPHFSEVIDYILISVNSNLRGSNILRFRPILLVGSNGIGKTTFINDLNAIFNLSNNTINYGSVTIPSEISGLTSIWRTGTSGFISKVVNLNSVYNPIVIFEEIDKSISGTHNGNVLAPLYDLFEKRTAKIFYDNYLGKTLDFSYVNYIATANNIKNIDYGIINRFTIFNIEKPKSEHMDNIIRSIYKELKKDDLYGNIVIDEEGIKSIINATIFHKINNIRAISKMIEKTLMQASLFNKNNDLFIIDYISDDYLNKDNTLH